METFVQKFVEKVAGKFAEEFAGEVLAEFVRESFGEFLQMNVGVLSPWLQKLKCVSDSAPAVRFSEVISAALPEKAEADVV